MAALAFFAGEEEEEDGAAAPEGEGVEEGEEEQEPPEEDGPKLRLENGENFFCKKIFQKILKSRLHTWPLRPC